MTAAAAPDIRVLPYWPALMDRHTAASYCEVSATHFEWHCPVRPVRLGRRLLWRRGDLDAWILSLPSVDPPRYGGSQHAGAEPPPGPGPAALGPGALDRAAASGNPAPASDDEPWLERLDRVHAHPRR